MTALSIAIGSVIFIGEVLIARKKWLGWLIVAAAMPALVYLHLELELWGFIPLNGLTLVNAAVAVKLWRIK